MGIIYCYCLPARVVQLVRANNGKCGPSKWHMVLGLNFVTDNTLNLPGAGCYGTVSAPRFGSPWRVLRAWPWKVPRLSKKKKNHLLSLLVKNNPTWFPNAFCCFPHCSSNKELPTVLLPVFLCFVLVNINADLNYFKIVELWLTRVQFWEPTKLQEKYSSANICTA